MSETELSVSQHEQATELNYRIINSASLAQSALWDMCTSLKKMRDSKLYKELGYDNFEDYCENEVGMKRRYAYKYISIAENINLENVPSMAQIGVAKLSLLATISEEQQQEISEKVDLEETTVKQLKAEIDQLKSHNKDLGAAKDRAVAALTPLEEEIRQLKSEQKNYEQLVGEINADKQRLEKELSTAKEKSDKKAVKELEEKIDALKERNARLMTKVDEAEQRAENSRKGEKKAYGRVSVLETDNEFYKKKIEQLEVENKKKGEDIISLESTVKELENRPIDIAVIDSSEETERKVKEAVEKLEQQSKQREAELEAQFRAEEKSIRKKLEEEKQTAISEVRSDYEKKLSESAAVAPVDENKLKFKVYLTSAYDTLKRLTDFTAQNTDPIYKGKIRELLNSVLVALEENNE